MSQCGRGREKVGGNVGGRETGATTPITHSIWWEEEEQVQEKQYDSFFLPSWCLEVGASCCIHHHYPSVLFCLFGVCFALFLGVGGRVQLPVPRRTKWRRKELY